MLSSRGLLLGALLAMALAACPPSKAESPDPDIHVLPLVDGALKDQAVPPDTRDRDVAFTCITSLCQRCQGSVPVMPADDEACGAIDCDQRDIYFVEGESSATGTNYRVFRDYHDLATNRCARLGACKEPNSPEACFFYEDSRVDSCGACLYATLSGCVPYADETPCGAAERCVGGECLVP